MPNVRRPLTERFWEKVDKSPTGCWEWIASARANGYGVFNMGRGVGEGVWRAHRVSWTLEYGPIPPGMWVLHHCDNRLCVRPDHLFLGSEEDNRNDMISKGRASWQSPPTECPQGHEYTEENTYWAKTPAGGVTRRCRTCRRVKRRAAKERRGSWQ